MFNLEGHEEKCLLCDKLEVLISWLFIGRFPISKIKKKLSSTSSYLNFFFKNTGGIVWNDVYVWLMPVGRKHWAGELHCI